MDVKKRIEEAFGNRLKISGIPFSVSMTGNPMVQSDIDAIVRCLTQFMENAIKYGDGRLVSLSFSEEEDCRLVTVSNTGCTLPEYELDHVFDSFWRGSNAGSNQGSGLGLYICQRLMHEMGGDIFAQIDNDMMRVTLVCRKCS